MRDPGVSERSQIRIRESNRNYSPKEQKAELLLRNGQFLEERERMGIPQRRVSTGTGRAIYKSIEFSAEWAMSTDVRNFGAILNLFS
jgi:hypothetical protein